MADEKEMRGVESFLKEELRYMDVDGTVIPIADMIDRVLEKDKRKRQYATG